MHKHCNHAILWFCDPKEIHWWTFFQKPWDQRNQLSQEKKKERRKGLKLCADSCGDENVSSWCAVVWTTAKSRHYCSQPCELNDSKYNFKTWKYTVKGKKWVQVQLMIVENVTDDFEEDLPSLYYLLSDTILDKCLGWVWCPK